MVKKQKQLKWDGAQKLFSLRVPKGDGEFEEQELVGGIFTRKGALARADKLRAIQSTDEWIEV